MFNLKILLWVVCFFLLFVFVQSAFAAKIILKSGQVIEADILEENPQYIKIKTSDVPITLYSDEIREVVKPEIEIYPLSADPRLKKEAPVPKSDDGFSGMVIVRAQYADKQGWGSGFVIDTQGTIVTNFHVVAGAKNVTTKLQDGKDHPVKRLAWDSSKDICLLEIEGTDLEPLNLGDSDQLTPGETVTAFGTKDGQNYQSAFGVYSGRRNMFGRDILQFTANIVPGYSGGALLNSHGEVIGINTFIRRDAQGYNFGVPINEVKKMLQSTPSMMAMETFAMSVGSAYAMYNAGIEAYFAGDTSTAIDKLKQAIEQDPGFAEALTFLGEIYDTMDDKKEESIATWIFLINLQPTNTEARLNLAVIYAAQANYDEAIAQLQKAVEINPVFAQAHDTLGVVYARKKMFSQSIEEHKKALEINPDLAQAHNNLSIAYFNLGEYKLAVEESDRAVELGYHVDENFLKDLQPYR